MSSVRYDVIRKLKQYEALGSIEELKLLKEKEKPKAPIFGRSLGVPFCKCPSCNRVIYDGDWYDEVVRRYFHERCVFCGQQLTKRKNLLGVWED